MRDWAGQALADPNTAFVCLMLGVLAVMWELCHPGAVLPGAAGGVVILLALWAFARLPLRPAAAAVVLGGVALLLAAPFLSAWFAWPAAVFVVAGFGFLVNQPSGIHPILVLALGGPVTGLSAFLWNLAVFATRNKSE